MTGVLERMVQRTRGTLPAAEPRIAVSTFSRQASTGGVDNAEWLGELSVQVENGQRAADGRFASASNASIASATSARNRTAGIDPHKATQLSERSNGVAAPSETPGPRTTRQTAAAGQEVAPAPRGLHLEAAASTPVTRDKSSLEPAQLPGEESPSRESIPIVQSAPQMEESSRPSAGERMSAVDDVQPAQPRADGDDRMQIVHEHREISISIGTVSMQSTPQPAPRLAPAFRPRVSLDAFLERRQGSR